jgi:hypothetical protein
MSPAELRDFAKAKDIDTSDIDARKKAQLVGLLSAWEAGESYTPSEPVLSSENEMPKDEPAQPQISEDHAQSLVEEYSGTVIDDAMTKPTSELTDKEIEASLAAISEPLPSVKTMPRRLAELTLDDLVNDRDRVVIQVNDFPVTVDGLEKCRLMIVQVPGEEDTLAAVWWVNSAGGPVMVAGIRRITERHYDAESETNLFTTEDGEQHTYSRTAGCSTCGNRLANWRPWSSPVRIVQAARH